MWRFKIKCFTGKLRYSGNRITREFEYVTREYVTREFSAKYRFFRTKMAENWAKMTDKLSELKNRYEKARSSAKNKKSGKKN